MGWHSHGGYFPHPPFPFFLFGIFFVLLIGFLIFKIYTYRRYFHDGGYRYGGRHEAETILMKRLANGEISGEEYKRLHELLNNGKS